MSTLRPEPLQPPESAWQFIKELRSPLWRKIHWRPRARRPHEADLREGVSLHVDFRDDGGRLATAYRDLERFLDAAGIRRTGPYSIVIKHACTPVREAYRLVVGRARCEVLAGDTEGIRRAIFFLEDEILRAGGPFLPFGTIERRPVIRTRISRCFFGPIHRPPRNRDELTDDVNYYPDEYLDRLAHESVNGLWLTIHFSEICRSAVIPEYGRDTARRVNKLRQTVEHCARYGIRIYAFANEPLHLRANSAVARAHPELLGHRIGSDEKDSYHHFCTSNPTARAYLEEAMRSLFTDVPGLGGLINISIGESPTHCYSWGAKSDCPRCTRRRPRDVLNDTLAAMERGMHAANPDAELISWPYTQYVDWGNEPTVDSAGCLPKGVILQHNFESAGQARQCGRWHTIRDYWLSWAGPSRLFRDCARAAVKHGNRVFAKLQVGCSHEVATVPFVPVPGQLYRKYRAMHRLGVSGVMQCWYFGNYPGVMTRAAGELAFAPLAKNENEFLLGLARRDWGRDAGLVARAWQWFQRGYRHFPMNHVFGWFGPVHDAPVWPLHLEPADRGIAPAWLFASYWGKKPRPIPASGDRIGECFAYSHSLTEILSLGRKMAGDWNRGVVRLRKLLPRYRHDRERRRDIGVAAALGIQLESAYQVFHFYALREELPYQARTRQLRTLRRMRAIVAGEIARDAELLELCRADSRLGFHSEAEGYKYFPAKIRWRMRQLRDLLTDGFPRVEAQIRQGLPLWPEYTGRQPTGRVYRCPRVGRPPSLDDKAGGHVWAALKEEELKFGEVHRSGKERGATDPGARTGFRTTWKACHDRKALYLAIDCRGAPGPGGEDMVRVLIEPRRLWPNQHYEVASDGIRRGIRYPKPEDRHWRAWRAVTRRYPSGWSATLRIPWVCLHRNRSSRRPIRIDIERIVNGPAGAITQRWMERHSLEGRLVFGTANPADLGWLIFAADGRMA